MTFLLVQIFSCLLAAALIGAVAAWFLRRNLARRRERIVQRDWHDRLRHVELERDRIVQRLSGELDKRSASTAGGATDPTVLADYDKLISTLEERVAEREGAIADQRSEIQELRAALNEAQGAAQSIETALQHEIETLQAEQEADRAAAGDERERRLVELENEIRQKDESLSELTGRLADVQTKANQSEEALRDRHEKELMALRIELDQASRGSVEAPADPRIAQLEEAVRQRDDSIAVLRDDLAELIQEKKIETRGRQDEQLRTAIADATSWQAKYETAAKQLAALELRVDELEAETAGADAAPGSGGAARAKKRRRKNPSRAAAVRPRSGGERIGSLLARPPGPRDNLQEIRGIGPMLEKLLNELGIFHFHQIASFGSDDIARISREIGRFGNRIERDDWVTQAGELHRKHHG